MGFLGSIRRLVGLSGPDGGVGSMARNVGQIELFGAVVQRDPLEAPANEVVLDRDALPWELREQDRRAAE